MAEMTDAYDWRQRTILDARGEKIGVIEAVYRDLETDQPAWALVHVGTLRGRSTFVPVGGAHPAGEDVQVQVEKGQVDDAPPMDVESTLSPDDEAELRRHYGVERRVQRPLAEPPPEP